MWLIVHTSKNIYWKKWLVNNALDSTLWFSSFNSKLFVLTLRLCSRQMATSFLSDDWQRVKYSLRDAILEPQLATNTWIQILPFVCLHGSTEDSHIKQGVIIAFFQCSSTGMINFSSLVFPFVHLSRNCL